MKIAAGRVKPCIDAFASIFGTEIVTSEIADKASDVIVALEGARQKVATMEKAIMGGRTSIANTDEHYTDVVAELGKAYETEIDLEVVPLAFALISDMKVNAAHLATLKLAGLVVK